MNIDPLSECDNNEDDDFEKTKSINTSEICEEKRRKKKKKKKIKKEQCSRSSGADIEVSCSFRMLCTYKEFVFVLNIFNFSRMNLNVPFAKSMNCLEMSVMTPPKK